MHCEMREIAGEGGPLSKREKGRNQLFLNFDERQFSATNVGKRI